MMCNNHILQCGAELFVDPRVSTFAGSYSRDKHINIMQIVTAITMATKISQFSTIPLRWLLSDDIFFFIFSIVQISISIRFTVYKLSTATGELLHESVS